MNMNNRTHASHLHMMGGENESLIKGMSINALTLPLFLLLMTFLFILPKSLNAQQVSFVVSKDTVYAFDDLTITNTSYDLPSGTNFRWNFIGTSSLMIDSTIHFRDSTNFMIIFIRNDSQFIIKPGFPSTLYWDTLKISLIAIDSLENPLEPPSYQMEIPICLAPEPPNFPCDDLINDPCVNLVCNPSFEDLQDFALDPWDLYKAAPWFGYHCEVYNQGSTGSLSFPPITFSVPTNAFGFQWARTGNGYGGFHPYCTSRLEVISTPLKYEMNNNQTYNVTFWASLADRSNRATPLIAYIEPETNPVQIIDGYDLEASIGVNPNGLVNNGLGFITDMDNWVNITGIFTPQITGDHRLYIGSPDPLAIIPAPGNWVGELVAYYFIDDVEVVPLPPSVTIDGSPIYVDGCLFYEMTTSDPQNVSRYEWSINGVVQPNSNVPSIILPSNGVSIDLTVYNYHNCPVTYRFPVDPPCIMHHSQGSLYDIILKDLTSTDIINNYSGGSPGWNTTEPINILGTLTIDQNFAFYGCDKIVMGRDAKIVVDPGISFSINGCTIFSCNPECFFWDGIYATDPNSRIEITESNISHAKNAVYSRNNPELFIAGNEFSFNLVGIHITNHQNSCISPPPPAPGPTPANVLITANTFWGDLHDFTALIYDYLPGFVGMEWGVRVDSVDLLTIGPNNTFDELSCGIHINTGNVVIEDNDFLNIKHHSTLKSTPNPWGFMTINNLFREGAIIVNQKVDYIVSKPGQTPPPAPPPPDYCVPTILSVIDNSFSDCHIGVYVFGHSTTLADNSFENITYNAFRGNSLPYASITNNEHIYNNTEPLHPSNNTFNYEYYIAPPKKSLIGFNIDISHNQILTYKSGINLINATSTGLDHINPKRWVTVSNNTIRINDVGENPFLQGIRLQGCDRSRVFMNIIENIDQYNYPTAQNPMVNLQGILVSQTTDARVHDNYAIIKFGKGINNIGYNLGTQFLCNNFYSNYNGFYAEPPGMAQNTILSDQLVTQKENRNCFFNNIDLWVNNQSSQGFKWFYTGNLTPPGNECTPSLLYYYDITPLVGASLECAPMPDYWEDPLTREVLFGSIARDEDSLYGALQDEFEWYARDFLFRSLYGDPMLMNMGVSEDSIYIHFYNFFSNSNIAAFAEIEYLIDNYDIEQALWENDNIVTQTLIEFNLQRVNEILLESWAQGYDVDSIQSSILQAIALLTPYVGGDAVFTARAMLDIDPFNHGLPYRKSGDDISAYELQLKIYPNPTRGNLTIEFTVPIEKSEGKLEFFDIQGRKVMNSPIDNTKELVHIDISNLKNGIYLMRVLMNDGRQFSQKLIKSQ